MRVILSLSSAAALVSLAAAAPAVDLQAAAPAVDLQTAAPVVGLQTAATAGNPCDVGFVFARGSTEPPPLGILVGPELDLALKVHLPFMKTFPVLYPALLVTNLTPDRTDPASIAEGAAAFKAAEALGCKKIVAAGYSQGAAVMHNVISKVLDEKLKEKILGVALFGDTRNAQDMGHIPNFPKDRSKVWCNVTDGVCGGALLVDAGHLAYSPLQIKEAAHWLSTKVKTTGISEMLEKGAEKLGKGAAGIAGTSGKATWVFERSTANTNNF